MVEIRWSPFERVHITKVYANCPECPSERVIRVSHSHINIYCPPRHQLPIKKGTYQMTGICTVLEFLNNLLGARNRVGIGLSYRPARLHSLAELVP